jgi:hypothetical protein
MASLPIHLFCLLLFLMSLSADGAPLSTDGSAALRLRLTLDERTLSVYGLAEEDEGEHTLLARHSLDDASSSTVFHRDFEVVRVSKGGTSNVVYDHLRHVTASATSDNETEETKEKGDRVLMLEGLLSISSSSPSSSPSASNAIEFHGVIRLNGTEMRIAPAWKSHVQRKSLNGFDHELSKRFSDEAIREAELLCGSDSRDSSYRALLERHPYVKKRASERSSADESFSGDDRGGAPRDWMIGSGREAEAGINEDDGADSNAEGSTDSAENARGPLETAPRHFARRRRGGADEPCVGRCTCPVTLLVDHRYFKSVAESSLDRATASAVSLLMDVNSIYRQTSFEGEVGYGFSVRRVIVYEDDAPPNPVGAATYTADKYLEAFSDTKYKDVCLAHMLTHYDFSAGTVGLAWVGQPQGTGMCDTNGYNTGTRRVALRRDFLGEGGGVD